MDSSMVIFVFVFGIVIVSFLQSSFALAKSSRYRLVDDNFDFVDVNDDDDAIALEASTVSSFPLGTVYRRSSFCAVDFR